MMFLFAFDSLLFALLALLSDYLHFPRSLILILGKLIMLSLNSQIPIFILLIVMIDMEYKISF